MNTMNKTVTAEQIKRMSDKDLALAVIESRKVVLPDCLNDVADVTQKFAYYIGLNSKPLVLDRKRFDEFMRDNNIPKNHIMSRVIRDDERHTAQEYVEMLKHSEYNYIGGKYYGKPYGAGTYFEMNGGGMPKTAPRNVRDMPETLISAVYNPATAKPIDIYTLGMIVGDMGRYRPEFVNAIGPANPSILGEENNASIYALSLGANVITEYYGVDIFAESAEKHGDRYGELCFIDRGALVILDE